MFDQAAVTFDDLASGINVDAGTIAGVINNATTENAAALATAIDDLLGGNPGPAEFTTLQVSGLSTLGPVIAEELEIDTGTKTAAATTGAATLNKSSGVITTEALTTAAGADYVLTLTNSKIAAGDLVFASVQNGSNSAGTPCVATVDTHTASTAVITIQNIHASAALNGTLKISFFVVKAGTPS